MKKTNTTDFAIAVTGFLTKYLPFQRNCSVNTVKSYTQTLRLFVRFIATDKGIDIAKFDTSQFTKDLVLDFMRQYRNSGASIAAANQRLAALKSFCAYACGEDVKNLQGLMDIRSIRSPKCQHKVIGFLTVEQTRKLINCPDARSSTGFRHKAILSLLYDSGCRVQELCDLTVGDVLIDESGTSTVCLHGKGKKDRVVFISKELAKLLGQYRRRFLAGFAKTDPFITNKDGRKMNREGVSYIVKKYGSQVALKDPTFPKTIHCHMLRHSKAMHMLQAGINLVYIRDFLGHENIATTMVYARADNRTKEEVIGKLAPKIAGEGAVHDWSVDENLLTFLESL